jgi:uncharacterized damage-inducible protein DinB
MTDRSFERANDASRERLARLAATVTPEQLATDIGGGWTVASALGHMGFWDRWQAQRWTEMLAGSWNAQDASVIAAEHLANESLEPYWAGIDGAGLAALALEAATRVDAMIAGATDTVVDALEGGPSAYLLHRYNHRGEHLDHIARHVAAEQLSAARSGTAAPDRVYVDRNRESLARLRDVLGTLTPADLATPVGDGAWTVGQVVGHLNFWDRFLASRWRAALAAGAGQQPTVLPHDVADLLNEAMPPTWAAFAAHSGGAAIAEALAAAAAVDALIESLPDETPVAAILAERPALLDRSIHRREHLASLESALESHRKG